MRAASPLRLRRVRFKDGRGELRLLKPKSDTSVRDGLRRSSESCDGSSVSNAMVGFALVAWSRDGEVFVSYETSDGSSIRGGAVPQYVKDCLLAEVAVRWSKDD